MQHWLQGSLLLHTFHHFEGWDSSAKALLPSLQHLTLCLSSMQYIEYFGLLESMRPIWNPGRYNLLSRQADLFLNKYLTDKKVNTHKHTHLYTHIYVHVYCRYIPTYIYKLSIIDIYMYVHMYISMVDMYI